MHTVRQPAVAGMFYPADRGTLERDVNALLDAARREVSNVPPPKALIAPHAGYIYSGSTAALGYATLEPARSTITRVILLGPTHRVAVRGMALPGRPCSGLRWATSGWRCHPNSPTHAWW